MCQYCAPEAVPHDWHLIHLGSRAVGGAGIVMTEATAVEPVARITRFDLGLWSDEQERACARIVSFVGQQGAVPGIQLAHAGRKASHRRPWEGRVPLSIADGGWEAIGPSPTPWQDGDLVPREMTAMDIERVIGCFREAARRAARAGFRLLELHAAHGYLLHSFLSPISNARRDGYGGSFERRCRLLLETVTAVRETWPEELPLFVRVSATDWAEGGWELEDTIRLARILATLGVDVIDCSSGGSTQAQAIDPRPGYQVPLAAAVRKGAGIATAAVGLLSDPAMIEGILTRGEADLAVLGRIALWDPYWPHHAADELGVAVALPVQYKRSNIHARGPTPAAE